MSALIFQLNVISAQYCSLRVCVCSLDATPRCHPPLELDTEDYLSTAYSAAVVLRVSVCVCEKEVCTSIHLQQCVFEN